LQARHPEMQQRGEQHESTERQQGT
jgi:hypothetical protein